MALQHEAKKVVAWCAVRDALVCVQVQMMVAKDVTNTVDVDFTTTIGAVATATFNAVGESLMVQWTGTDGWAVIGHGTGATGDMGTGPTLS